MKAVMSLHNVTASYDGKAALEQFSLEIPEKQILAVVGPSGCGKSTLLRCLNGMLHREPGTKVTGEIQLRGKSIDTIPPGELCRRVGLVFQTPSPFPMSIRKNMTYALRYYGQHDKVALENRIRETLEVAGLYDEVKDELDKSALKLSGGQQQRLCIARALTVEPEVLLLDEPCSALDVKSTRLIEELLLRLKERCTIVIVTHNLAQAHRIADRTAFLYQGHLVEEGDTETLFTNAKEEATRDFLAGVFG